MPAVMLVLLVFVGDFLFGFDEIRALGCALSSYHDPSKLMLTTTFSELWFLIN